MAEKIDQRGRPGDVRLSSRPQRQVFLDNIRRGDRSRHRSLCFFFLLPCRKVREICSHHVNFVSRSLFATLQSSPASHRTQWRWKVSRPASSAKPTATQSQKSTGSAQKGGLYLIARGTKPRSVCSEAGFTLLVSVFTADSLPESLMLFCRWVVFFLIENNEEKNNGSVIQLQALKQRQPSAHHHR